MYYEKSNNKFLHYTFCLLLIIGSFENVRGWDNAEFEMFDLVEEVGKNFYEVMGLTQDASSKEIKQAYRKLSVKLHPDKNPSPDASTEFRQLVGIYEVLKNAELRESYHQVLVDGLPNWRQPIFYFRRARKFALWQVAVIILSIVSIGQYLAAWASYFEQKLSLNEMKDKNLKKALRHRKAQRDGRAEEISAEFDSYLQTPSLWNIAPFQILRFFKYMIFNMPGDILAYLEQEKEKREEERIKKEREEERLKAEKLLAEEPKKPRKRKTIPIPEKEDGEELPPGWTNQEIKDENPMPKLPPMISGGLWTDDDIAELAKLCSKFPGGTPERWEKISALLNRPVPEVTFMAKKVLEKLAKRETEEEEVPVQPKIKVKTKAVKGEGKSVENWTVEEQKSLEKALQKYPKEASDRWDKIAEMVQSRTKDECIQRFKYLTYLVKKKKTDKGSNEPEPAIKEEKVISIQSVPQPNSTEKDNEENSTPVDTQSTVKTDESILEDQLRQAQSDESNKSENKLLVGRQDSSSSSSDNDWLIVDEAHS